MKKLIIFFSTLCIILIAAVIINKTIFTKEQPKPEFKGLIEASKRIMTLDELLETDNSILAEVKIKEELSREDAKKLKGNE